MYLESRQRDFSHNTIQQACPWLKSYPGFDFPKINSIPRVSSLKGSLTVRPSKPNRRVSVVRRSLVRDASVSSYTANQQNQEAVSFAKHYYPSQHKFVNALVGEIRLPVPIFQLVPPSLETLSSPRALTSHKNRQVSFAYEPAQALLLELKSYQLQFATRKVNRKQAMLRAIRDLKDMNFTPEDFMVYSKHMSQKPYAEPQSRQFLIACKIGDDWTARRMLELNPHLLHVFDSTHLTGLHWAAKRNHIPLLLLLIKRRALLNARDQVPIYQTVWTNAAVPCSESRRVRRG